MTTKRKRGPVIKTDWMLEVDGHPGVYWGPYETKDEVKERKLSKLHNYAIGSRIIERKWRVVG